MKIFITFLKNFVKIQSIFFFMLTVKYLNSTIDYFGKDLNNVIYEYAKEFPFIKEIQTYNRATYQYELMETILDIEVNSLVSYFTLFITKDGSIYHALESVFNSYKTTKIYKQKC